MVVSRTSFHSQSGNGESKMSRSRIEIRFRAYCSARSRVIARNCCFWILLTLATEHQGIAQSDIVVVRPKEIHDVLVNPGMGITTFQRFNGQATNAPLKWSEVGPVTKLPQAPMKPDFPETSISYSRWCWKNLEPEPGKFHWEIVDLAVEEARAHGQTLAIRLMPYSNQDALPDWYRNSGARRANKTTDKDGGIWQPDFSDPLYLTYRGTPVPGGG